MKTQGELINEHEQRIKDLEMHVAALNSMNTHLIVRAERAELAIEELQITVEIILKMTAKEWDE